MRDLDLIEHHAKPAAELDEIIGAIQPIVVGAFGRDGPNRCVRSENAADAIVDDRSANSEHQGWRAA